ncbi:trigger factor [Methylocella silvestris BL2]|uniref:Trigger factor n=1 Tax=Methylocella silvestris (strain DSM 15510 / CIP 108128 / LMG 27833 / NCIMB 13906 / BL2) TaxID=395965 RepID=TIG_METSB|nr:trigger factor [Methylocella silvestris]B8EIL1.1 RecName: Full=Trigger factor; Short=TF; AltName: Full=PPIase [Methylocella silvestris BL2]ACK51828.1 trigger factor [Methylocella silvestris BL2]
MQVTETLSQGLKREFQVVLPATDLATRLDSQLAEMRAKARINGFRPGKVPVAHLKRLYGRSIMAEVVQEAVNEAHRKIIEDNALRPASQPKIDFPGEKDELEKAFEAKADFAFTVALEVLPKIEIGSFEGVEIERLVAAVSEDEIDLVVNRLAEQSRPYTPKEGDGVVATKGDKATIDFVGKIDGEAFEGGSGEGVDLVLGSGSFIPGFEEQLEGLKLGDSRTVTVTFPDDYSAAHLAGKEAVFDVTLKALAAPGETVIDDAFAKGYGLEDLTKLRESIKANIERDYAAASRRKWKRALLDALDAKYAFDLPEGLVAQEFDAIWRRVEAEQSQSGRSFADEGTTEEAARADYRKIAERRVRLGLLLADVGDAAGVKVADEEVNQALFERARSFPGQEKMVWDYYQKNPSALAELRAPIYEEKVVDHILSLVKVTDKAVPKEELLAADEEDEEEAAESSAALV